MRRLQPYVLLHAIVLETRAGDDVKEEELRPEGFTVTLRRPKAKDLMLMDDFSGRPIAGTMAMLERISNLDKNEVANLDGEDMANLGERLETFSASGPPTGETS